MTDVSVISFILSFAHDWFAPIPMLIFSKARNLVRTQSSMDFVSSVQKYIDTGYIVLRWMLAY